MQLFTVAADGSAQFTTINQALAVAPPHSRILVKRGIYREEVMLDKPLELIADDERENVVIEAHGAALLRTPTIAQLNELRARDPRRYTYGTVALHLHTDAATVRGFTVRAYLGEGNSWAYFQYERVRSCYITDGASALEDCLFWSDFAFALTVEGATARPTIRRCQVQGAGGGGVVFYKSARGMLENSEICHVTGGLEISHEADPLIRKCRIHHCRGTGIDAAARARGTIEDCEIYQVEFAVSLANSYTTLRRCTVHDAEIGISADDTNTIEDCRVLRVKQYSPRVDIRPDDFIS